MHTDAENNVTTTAYAYDARNRLLSAGGKSYTYDDGGRMLTETVGAETTSYVYDSNSRLIQITAPGNEITTFSYNADGIRRSKTTGGTTTEYIYDGTKLIAEMEGGSTTRSYNWGAEGIVSFTDAAGTHWYQKDALGNVTGLVDDEGTVTDTYSYDAFGSTLAHTGSTDQPFEYVGTLGYYQQGSLQLLTHRYYDPSTGRFVSEDPIGYAGGDWNLYRYAGGDPVRYVDPEGQGIKDRLKEFVDWLKEQIERLLHDRINLPAPTPSDLKKMSACQSILCATAETKRETVEKFGQDCCDEYFEYAKPKNKALERENFMKTCYTCVLSGNMPWSKKNKK